MSLRNRGFGLAGKAYTMQVLFASGQRIVASNFS
jgi:hypothetical protein